MNKELLTFISNANKNGFVKAGDLTTGTALSSGKTELIIVAKNASNSIKTKFGQLGYRYDVEIIAFAEKTELSWITGKNDVEVLAIIDKETAEEFKRKFEELS